MSSGDRLDRLAGEPLGLPVVPAPLKDTGPGRTSQRLRRHALGRRLTGRKRRRPGGFVEGSPPGEQERQPARLLDQALSDASPDLMRRLLSTVINALLSAEADAVCGAEWGQPSAKRVNQRNGYRHRELDTRVGTVDVAVPKLRHERADSKKEISSLAMGSGSSSGAK
jgi:hypothetical protein